MKKRKLEPTAQSTKDVVSAALGNVPDKIDDQICTSWSPPEKIFTSIFFAHFTRIIKKWGILQRR